MIFCAVFTKAQDPGYNGPAATSVKKFWDNAKAITELLDKGTTGSLINSKMTPMERSFNETKTKDPSYNISSMELELKKIKNRIQSKTITADEAGYCRQIWATLVSVYSKDGNTDGMPYGTKYYEAVKSMDLENYRKKKEELKNKGDKTVPLIDEILNDYNNFIERTGMIKNLRPANTSEAKTPADKKELLTEMKMQCEGVLLVSPDNAAAKEKLLAVTKALAASDAAMAAFFTSDFHKENYNKIVWSTRPLIIGKEKEMAAFIKTAFTAGEPIFGTVYLGRNIKDAQNNIESLPVRIEVNGSNTITGDGAGLIVPVAIQGRSYLQFALLPDAQWIKDNYAAYIEQVNETYPRFMDVLVRNGEDKHEVSFELKFRGIGAEEIKSTFSIDLSSGVSGIKTMAAQLHAAHFAHIKLPAAGMSNPALEQKMLAAANGLGWKDKFTKIIITSRDWSTRKNELTGALLYRSMAAVAITTDTEGNCYYQEFTFRQDYSGDGNYESTVKYNGYGGKRQLACDKIK